MKPKQERITSSPSAQIFTLRRADCGKRQNEEKSGRKLHLQTTPPQSLQESPQVWRSAPITSLFIRGCHVRATQWAATLTYS
jgi:hypothetical protein